jgi:glycosyltransferase involved in cell wall biosynthesis
VVGLGIVTFNRPDYFEQCIDAVFEHLSDVVDFICVYDDGSDDPARYDLIRHKYMHKHMRLHHAKENKGVATAKNWCLKQMMDAGCDYLFLLEDDILPQSPDAITNYIAASLDTGIHHFMFAHHGPGNQGPDGLRGRHRTAEFYLNCIGAYTFYTRRCIEEVGYFDEAFKNAIEHIEHTNRIAYAGFHPPLSWGYADVALSHKWLKEIPGSINGSVIRPRADWLDNVVSGLEHWRRKDPARFPFDAWLMELKKDQARRD